MLVAVRSLSVTAVTATGTICPPDIHVQRESAAIATESRGVQRAVRQNMKYGADWIKIPVTGGVTSAGTNPAGRLHAGRDPGRGDDCRACGLDVAAHAHGEEGILRAARAGCGRSSTLRF